MALVGGCVWACVFWCPQSCGLVRAGSSLAAKAQNAPPQASLCTPAENVVLPVATGGKMVSVCASGTLARRGYLHYRFGKPDSLIHRTLPEARVAPAKAANGGSEALFRRRWRLAAIQQGNVATPLPAVSEIGDPRERSASRKGCWSSAAASRQRIRLQRQRSPVTRSGLVLRRSAWCAATGVLHSGLTRNRRHRVAATSLAGSYSA